MQPFLVAQASASRHAQPRQSPPAVFTDAHAAAATTARSRLGARVHRLHGIGAGAQAHASRTLPGQVAAFGGLDGWRALADPWIAARGLAGEPDTLPAMSTERWFGIVRTDR